MACIACQRQQREERKNSETQREMQERAAAEHSAEAQQRVTQGEGNPNARGKRSGNDPRAWFFSVFRHVSGKALILQIASTKVSTAPDRAHALADQRDAFVNANTVRTPTREVEQEQNGKTEKQPQGGSPRFGKLTCRRRILQTSSMAARLSALVRRFALSHCSAFLQQRRTQKQEIVSVLLTGMEIIAAGNSRPA